jgi:ABC-2 type transport system ATP-binding protein
MDEAEYCHRLALMYRGRVIALGAPAALKNSLRSHVLLRLESPEIFRSMQALPEVDGAHDVAVFGAGLHITADNPDVAGRIRACLDRHGIQVDRLEEIQPSMEDVFVAMIEDEDKKAA